MTSAHPLPPFRGFTEVEWGAARPFDEYLASISEKREIWERAVRRAEVSDDARARLEDLPGKRHVLILTAGWCGDAARSVPVLAAACNAGPEVEHRYLDVDQHPGTLDRFRTHGGRAVPLALVQDPAGAWLGLWGPRPAPLQALLRARKREIGPPNPDTKATWYAPILGWYGKDAGRTTIDELLMILERGGAAR